MRADDVEDRVGFADVAEEAVAEALAAMRARDQPGDVVEGDRVEHDLARADSRRNLLEALVADRDDRDVRLDRRERVVRRLGARLRERVEERGLARVRQPDDADLHECPDPSGASAPSAVPSITPARTSEG